MMQTAPKEAELLNKIENFAREHITPNRQPLITSHDFPPDLWQAFTKSGLAGLSVPTEYGGYGARYQTLSKAAYILNLVGGVPGVTMVFISHWLFTKLHIVENGSQSIKEELFPLLQSGEATLSVAISEPGAGAHPKYMKTSAARTDEHYILNGEKAFLTNGPLANYFIVVAITREQNNRKTFSAILIPLRTDGITQTSGIEIDFLHPCPHGGILLKDCKIPAANLIGDEGKAFEQTSLRMRAIEDAIGSAGQVATLSCLLADITPHLNSESAAEIGAISTQLQALNILAAELARKAADSGEDVQSLFELQLGFRQFFNASSDMLKPLIERASDQLETKTHLLYRDICKYQAIASNAHKTRYSKIGNTVLHVSKNMIR